MALRVCGWQPYTTKINHHPTILCFPLIKFRYKHFSSPINFSTMFIHITKKKRKIPFISFKYHQLWCYYYRCFTTTLFRSDIKIVTHLKIVFATYKCSHILFCALLLWYCELNATQSSNTAETSDNKATI